MVRGFIFTVLISNYQHFMHFYRKFRLETGHHTRQAAWQWQPSRRATTTTCWWWGCHPCAVVLLQQSASFKCIGRFDKVIKISPSLPLKLTPYLIQRETMRPVMTYFMPQVSPIQGPVSYHSNARLRSRSDKCSHSEVQRWYSRAHEGEASASLKYLKLLCHLVVVFSPILVYLQASNNRKNLLYHGNAP